MPLVRQLSNHFAPLVSKRVSVDRKLLTASERHDSGRKHTRLSDEDAKALAADYIAGATLEALAKKWNINRSTISLHLNRQGIPRRQSAGVLTDEALGEAARLYRGGASLNSLGQQFGLDPKTVRKRLAASGVAIRRSNRQRG